MATYNKELGLDSAIGNHIQNRQVPTISFFERNFSDGLLKEYQNVTPRSPLCPVYNCHGLTFGSRRTWIDRSPEVFKILTEDSYQDISDNSIYEGDIIIYYGPDNDIEHSGIVVSRPSSKNNHVPIIVSKWGKGQEMIHKFHECPYYLHNIRYYRINYGQFQPV